MANYKMTDCRWMFIRARRDTDGKWQIADGRKFVLKDFNQKNSEAEGLNRSIFFQSSNLQSANLQFILSLDF